MNNVEFTWEMLTIDDEPLRTNMLSSGMQTNSSAGALEISGLHGSSDAAKVRCLVREKPDATATEKESTFWASQFITFSVSERDEIDVKPPVTGIGKSIKFVVITQGI